MHRHELGVATMFFIGATLAAAFGCTKPSDVERDVVVAAIADPGAVSASEDGNGGDPTNAESRVQPQAKESSPKQGKVDQSAKATPDNAADESFEAFAKPFFKELNAKISQAEEGKEVDFAPLVKRLSDRLAKNAEVSELDQAVTIARVLEVFSPAETVRPIYDGLNKFADRVAFNNPGLAANVREVAKSGLARLNLVGTQPKVEGTTVDGTKVDLSEYKGKVVLIDFWATWCGPCLAELPNVKKVYEKYHDKGFEVVGISLDDDPQALAEFLEKEELPWISLFPTGPDRGFAAQLAKEFHVEGIPATFLIDRGGKLVSISARGERLESQVKSLLAP